MSDGGTPDEFALSSRQSPCALCRTRPAEHLYDETSIFVGVVCELCASRIAYIADDPSGLVSRRGSTRPGEMCSDCRRPAVGEFYLRDHPATTIVVCETCMERWRDIQTRAWLMKRAHFTVEMQELWPDHPQWPDIPPRRS
ncbi:hypothetical protein [Rhodococcus sp. HNM0569]|uniref:hypothetical protein n=1 Tax=Rhodococcus sp. HNM0569 TaxID=2716340 RepID=UPI001469C30F|nr:hypothetical protein [Rhodococcus sp. HNM0569]NLU83976.1 hypothetical protein [Rhodococcus sp. HNM0569]